VADASELPPPSSMPLCDKYRGDDNTFGYCISRFANSLQTIAEMEAACVQAGDWEGDCRHGWVAGRQQPGSGFSTEALLQACGEAPDCAFELIDFRPDPDPVAQISLCAKHTGPYARDCAGHAMQRFWLTEPAEDAWARVATTPMPFQDRVGYWLGVEVQCYSRYACMGSGPTLHNCQQTVSDFQRSPARCPKRVKQPAHPSSQGTPPSQPGGAATPPGGAQRPGGPGRPPGMPPGARPPGQGG